jgi:endoglucanase
MGWPANSAANVTLSTLAAMARARRLTAGEWWINLPGCGLGVRPTTNPGLGNYVDAYLWVKTPSESDGSANGGPPAGEWFEAYAQKLIANAVLDS